MPRFVVLRHDCPPDYPRPLHWDFMLEAAGALATWALSQEPAAGIAIAAEALADHRLAYLDFEGAVSGGRGSVARWDQGDYRLVSRRDDQWVVDLRGVRLLGRVTLKRAAGAASEWRWRFAPGNPAQHP